MNEGGGRDGEKKIKMRLKREIGKEEEKKLSFMKPKRKTL